MSLRATETIGANQSPFSRGEERGSENSENDFEDALQRRLYYDLAERRKVRRGDGDVGFAGVVQASDAGGGGPEK